MSNSYEDKAIPRIVQEMLDGEGMGLVQAASLFPSTKKQCAVNPATLWKWATTGVKLPTGQVARLETLRMGRGYLTTKPAVARLLTVLLGHQDSEQADHASGDNRDGETPLG